ncbi:MAG: SMI1/KNR4 family protein [Candidatus Sericytochromatia bacterium]
MKIEIINPNPPISLNEIDLFEAQFKIKLPKEYKEFLLVNNGGLCNFDIDIYYETKDEFNSEIYVSEFYKLEKVAHFIRCKDTTTSINECYKNGTIIIADYDTQEISIGFKKKNFGKVFHSIYMESVELTLIASSFDKFINGLKKRQDFIHNNISTEDEVHWFTKYLMDN